MTNLDAARMAEFRKSLESGDTLHLKKSESLALLALAEEAGTWKDELIGVNTDLRWTRGTLQIVEGERDSLAASLATRTQECEGLKDVIQTMREAMGEEWPLFVTSRPESGMCPECDQWKHVGHKEYCSRGKFFAVLALLSSSQAAGAAAEGE